MGANAQVALEKFARYFDVEARMVPVDESTNYVLDPERAMQYVDEVSVPGCLLRLPQKTTLIFSSPSLQNTIGVFVILGSTYTGTYESVEGMSKKLDEYEAKTGIFVPVRSHETAQICGRPLIRSTPLYADPRRRRFGWVLLPLRDSVASLGLQAAACRLDQREWAQVRPHLRRLRYHRLARQEAPPEGLGLHLDLPRKSTR